MDFVRGKGLMRRKEFLSLVGNKYTRLTLKED
jgi:hypothetical protein